MSSTKQSRHLHKVNKPSFASPTRSISLTLTSSGSNDGSPESLGYLSYEYSESFSPSYSGSYEDEDNDNDEDYDNNKYKPKKKSPSSSSRRRKGSKRRRKTCDSITIFFCTITIVMVAAMALMASSLLDGDDEDLSNWTHKEPGDLIQGTRTHSNTKVNRLGYSKLEMIGKLHAIKDAFKRRHVPQKIIDGFNIHDVSAKMVNVVAEEISSEKVHGATTEQMNNVNEVRNRLVKNQRLRKRKRKVEEQEKQEKENQSSNGEGLEETKNS